MWIVWTISAVSFALLALCVGLLRGEFRTAGSGWRMLAASGLPLALGGLGFIVRFWEPQSGPYLANEVYPLGPYLNTWVVSFGFMWLAFGMVFFALALLAPRNGRVWVILFLAWLLAWLPHGIIGIGFVLAGSNQPSVDFYRDWASSWTGYMQLGSSAVIMLAHFGLAIAGFLLTGVEVRRRARP